ncbi:hypothetical protein AZOA_06810 [Azoarcus sp. Aa7]|nr:hypothetical protein [Azoarcus sp. Aa7]
MPPVALVTVTVTVSPAIASSSDSVSVTLVEPSRLPTGITITAPFDSVSSNGVPSGALVTEAVYVTAPPSSDTSLEALSVTVVVSMVSTRVTLPTVGGLRASKLEPPESATLVATGSTASASL